MLLVRNRKASLEKAPENLDEAAGNGYRLIQVVSKEHAESLDDPQVAAGGSSHSNPYRVACSQCCFASGGRLQ